VALDEDRILVAATKEHAPRLVGALESLLTSGTASKLVRERAPYAVALAGISASADGAAALTRLAGAEADPERAEAMRRAATLLLEGGANAKLIERLLD